METTKQLERGRYRRENGQVVVDVAVKNSRQLFNERDPAPFRERDLDENFVTYVSSSVQEFPLKTPMKLRIVIQDKTDLLVEQNILREAIRAHFIYESRLAQAKLQKRLRVGRWFFLIGLVSLFVCLSASQFLSSLESSSQILPILREGFVIVGWVAMWRPIDVFLYDWWHLLEQRRFLEKIVQMSLDVQRG